MANATISQIKVGNTTYDIHDATVDNLETRLNTLESSVANKPDNKNVVRYVDPNNTNFSGLARGTGTDGYSDTGWLRTTASGFLPHTQDSNGNGAIGTSYWPFSSVTAKTLNGNLAASYVTGTLPVAHGGTGVTSRTLVTSGVWTATSGWRNDEGVYWAWGYLHGLRAKVYRTGADISGLDHGNIPDIQVGTLAAAYRPTYVQNWQSNGDNEWVCGYIAPGGGIFLSHFLPKRGFSQGRYCIFTIVWMT